MCIRDSTNGPLAQLAEQLTLNQWVRGSIPRWITMWALSSAAVSYTHLDVYKRQALSYAFVILLGTVFSFWAYIASVKYIRPAETSIIAVSYTHLSK